MNAVEAYGGSVIQGLGYYPFGSKEFSDLVPSSLESRPPLQAS